MIGVINVLYILLDIYSIWICNKKINFVAMIYFMV